MATHSSVLAWRIPGTGEPWWAAVYGVAQSWTRLKRLSSSKLADIKQGEKETPSKFLDRLRLAVHKFTDVDPESAEGGMILEDRFLTSQLQIPAISYKNTHLDQISL